MSIRGSISIGMAVTAAWCGSAVTLPAQAADGPIEEVIVRGIRASLQQSILTKRAATTIVDAISSEDVGKFPDKNVAEALQRVPGVVINREFGEGERVSLRGTAPNLTRTLLNGHALATADWFILEQLAATRSFNYLMLPADVIGQVAVYKTPQADFEEGGIGGTVNVVTRNPLDMEPFVALGSLANAYTELSDKSDPQATGLVSWKNSDQTFGVLAAAIYQKRRIRRDGVETLGYFDNDPGATELLVPSLIGSALFQQERVRAGGNLAVQWQPTEALSFNLTGLFSRFDADNLNENYLAWGSNALGGGGTLSDVVMQGNTAVAGRIASTPGGRGVVYDAIDRDALAETRSIDLDTSLALNEQATLHMKLGYTDARGDTKSQPFVEFGAPAEFTYDLRGGVPKVNFTNIDTTDPDALAFDFASLHQITNDDSELYVYADLETKLDLGPLQSVKFGAKHTDHDRETRFTATTFGGFFLPLSGSGCSGGMCTAADFFGGLTPGDYLDRVGGGSTLDSYFEVNRSAVRGLLSGVPGALENRIPNPPENFDINEKTYAGYAMANLGGERWRGNAGVRVVRTEQQTTGNVVGTAGPGVVSNAFGNFVPVSVDRSYTDVLPSVNLAFDLTDQLVLRVAAARTIARPDFTDIVPRVSLNPGSLTGSGGDPAIDPFRANQFDTSVEWYPAPNTAFALAVYYKDIESFITDRPTTGTFSIETMTPNLSLCTSAGAANPNLFNCQFVINRRANGGGGSIQGLELSGTAPVWGGFGVQANYTYADAEADSGDPVPGNSRNSYNLAAYFENSMLSVRLAYTFRSDFFVTFDRSTQLNQKELESLDASVVVNVMTGLALTFDAVNLTNDRIEQFAGSEFRPRAIYDNGRIYFGGVRLKF
jgi:iron complex outermembrane recepter protein